MNLADADLAVRIGDIVRVGSLGTGGGSLGLTVLICWLYVRVYLRDRRIARAMGKSLEWRGLLPIHVALIAVSHAILTATVMVVIYQRIHTPVRATTVLSLVAHTLSMIALYVMSRYQKRTYPRPPRPPNQVKGRRRR